jgi:hypothetical protein
MRCKELPQTPKMIIKVNMIAYNTWIASGLWAWRAKNCYGALENYGNFAQDPKNKKKIYIAI